MLMVLMGSRCHTSGMRIQSHAGVTLLPVYMPRVRTLGPDHLRSDLREPNEHNLLLSPFRFARRPETDRAARPFHFRALIYSFLRSAFFYFFLYFFFLIV